MSQKSIQLLKDLTQADAISGHEFEVKSIFRSRLEKAGDINLDRIGSIFCTKVGDSEAPRILLDSHMSDPSCLQTSAVSRIHCSPTLTNGCTITQQVTS